MVVAGGGRERCCEGAEFRVTVPVLKKLPRRSKSDAVEFFTSTMGRALGVSDFGVVPL